MRRLIINADDFGLAPSVNQAIIDCFRRGNVTSTTLMANMPAAKHAARLAKENPGLSVGLHFSITEGPPLSACSTLVDARGVFLDRTRMLIRAFFGRIDPDDVERELSAQLASADSLGVKISHIDSHQHVHMSPPIFERVSAIARKKGLPIRLVYPAMNRALLFQRPLKFLKQLAVYLNSRRYLARGISKSNDCLLSIHDLSGVTDGNSSVYQGLLQGAGDRETVEIMVHPYVLGEDVLALYPEDLRRRRAFLEKCEIEYRLLSGAPVFADWKDFRLATYADL